MNVTTQATETARDWTQAPLSALIAHIIVRHHAYLRAELPKIEGMLQQILQKPPEDICDFVEPLAQQYFALKEELESHMMKEEMVLFPHVVSLEAARSGNGPAPVSPFGTVRNPIRMMEQEHQGAKQALAEMRRLTKNYELPPEVCGNRRALFDALQGLEADLHQHIHLEDDVLFPRAIELEAAA